MVKVPGTVQVFRMESGAAVVIGGAQFGNGTTTGGFFMPVYDYVCLDCHKPFETVLTLNEHDKDNPKCPHCGSKNVEQEAAAFFAVTSRKS